MQTQQPNIFDKFKALPKGQKIFIVIGIIVLLGSLSRTHKKHSSSTSSDRYESQSTENCFGSESCISKVRENFNNTGKTILGEEYLGNGKFGISFMDSQHPGVAYDANVKTDCNCNVLDVNVSTTR